MENEPFDIFQTGKIKILLLEERAGELNLIRENLIGTATVLFSMSQPDSALRHVAEHGVDVILARSRYLRSAGPTWFEFLRSAAVNAACFILVEPNRREEMETMKWEGIHGFLLEPVKREDLRSAVSEALKHRKGGRTENIDG